MLSFGTRKKYSEEWTEYDLLEDLLESILEDEHGETVLWMPLKSTDNYVLNSRKETSRRRKRSHCSQRFLKMMTSHVIKILLSRGEPTPGIALEMKNLEDAAFALLEAMLEDDDEPIDEDILFPPRKFRQLQHNESLMEAYVLVDSIVQVGRDLNRIEFTFHNIRD
ncbi:hypothetical protein GQ600_24535 [Phytophthora cactorum]|nr:hypothetical protein GQ600_24535 [Phytophthora cactorum]